MSSKNFDFNAKDLNKDTAICVACEFPNNVWVVKALVSMKHVDVNVVNDFDCSAVDNCIRNNNMEALKLLGQRPDLKIRKKSKDLAKECGINLEDYIKPTDSIFGKYVVKNELAQEKEALEYELEASLSEA